MSVIKNGFFLFWGQEDWASQWHPSDFVVSGVHFNCAEQYMMAGKAYLFKDDATLKAIMKSKDPKKQKKLGREVKGFDENIWNSRCRHIVREGNIAKFSQNEDLKAQLLSTSPLHLVEASPYDKIWGIGLAPDDPKAANRANWLGKNWLGEVLMEVRDLLEKE